MIKNCSHNDCRRKAVSKGMCDKHYRRILHDRAIPSRFISEGDEIDRFFDKIQMIPESGCWIWIGGTRASGKGILYGRHWLDKGKAIGAHRFSYIYHHGDISGNLFVCHKCDVPLCVNPRHLFTGTHRDNMKDMVSKNRSAKRYGQAHHLSKITNKDAIKIRQDIRPQHFIAKDYGVTQTTISRIKRGVSY